MVIVHQNLPIPKEEYFVHYMSLNMGLHAEFINVLIRKLPKLRPVLSIRNNRKNTFKNTMDTVLLAFREYCSDQMKTCLGHFLSMKMCNHMMNLLQSYKEIIILLLQGFIV
jgi:hypothetical protein